MTEENKYNLLPAVEQQVILHLCDHAKFSGKYIRYVDAAAFENSNAVLLGRALTVYYKQKKHSPSSKLAIMQLLYNMVEDGKVSEEQYLDVEEYVEQAEDARGTIDVDDLEATFTPAVEHLQSIRVLGEMANAVAKNRSVGEFERDVQNLKAIGRVEETRVLTMAEVFEESKIHVDRQDTGIPILDNLIDGGFKRGTLTCFAAGGGGGKSVALGCVAIQAAMRERFSMYVSLEVPSAAIWYRLLANIIGKPIRDVEDDYRYYADKIQEQSSTIENIRVVDMDEGSTYADLLVKIKQVEEAMGRQVEVLVVDYADRMRATKGTDSEYSNMKEVYESLRKWAFNNKRWCFTASQLRRMDGKSPGYLAGIDDLADSQHKARIVDALVTINTWMQEGSVSTAKPDERELQLFIAKNRHGSGVAASARAYTDFAFGRLQDLCDGS